MADGGGREKMCVKKKSRRSINSLPISPYGKTLPKVQQIQK